MSEQSEEVLAPCAQGLGDQLTHQGRAQEGDHLAQQALLPTPETLQSQTAVLLYHLLHTGHPARLSREVHRELGQQLEPRSRKLRVQFLLPLRPEQNSGLRSAD